MKNILILDDNKDILQALKVGLCSCMKECEILTALNGEKGREILKNNSVDLILTDLDMPVMSGYPFIEKARRDHPLVPVCVMAGTIPPDVMERLNHLGVKRFIRKPFLFDDLASLIAEELKLSPHIPLAGESGHV